MSEWPNSARCPAPALYIGMEVGDFGVGMGSVGDVRDTNMLTGTRFRRTLISIGRMESKMSAVDDGFKSMSPKARRFVIVAFGVLGVVIAVLASSFVADHRETARIDGYVGNCISMPPMKTVEVLEAYVDGRGHGFELLQTDWSGNQSYLFAPREIVSTKTIVACPKH